MAFGEVIQLGTTSSNNTDPVRLQMLRSHHKPREGKPGMILAPEKPPHKSSEGDLLDGDLGPNDRQKPWGSVFSRCYLITHSPHQSRRSLESYG